MDTRTIVSFAALIMAVLAHAAASIWWASKITTVIEGISNTLTRFEKEFEKREKAMEAVWRKVDEVKDRVTTLEAHQET